MKCWVCAVAKEIETHGFSDHRLSDRCNQGRRTSVAEVRVFYDREGHTLTVRVFDSSREFVCEETGDEVVLMKDADSEPFRVASETAPA